MDPPQRLSIATGTDPGRVRARNEDCVRYDAALGVVVLADGMGGHRSGQVASTLAVETIFAELHERLPGLGASETDDPAGESPLSRRVRAAIVKANDTIYQTAQSRPQYYGMGTTLIMAVFHDQGVTVANVGDSRAYRFRGEALEQITTDHTLLQELVDRGLCTQADATGALNKSVVTRALGIQAEVAVDVHEAPTQSDDVYVLCSDGLNDMVADDDIGQTLRAYRSDLDQAVTQLIAAANANGGRDNISVALAAVGEAF